MQAKRWNKTDLFILITAGVVAIIVIIWLAVRSGSGGYVPGGFAAVVTVNGETVLTLPLEQYQNETIIDLNELSDIPANLELKDGKIRFVNVSCPDHLCEKVGWIGTAEHQTAVCMPNRAAVTILKMDEIDTAKNPLTYPEP